MNEKKKILIISLGSIGQRHLKNTRTLLPDSEIAVLRRKGFEVSKKPVEANIQFQKYEDAVNYDPDAVIIASPANLHLQDATTFIKNNKNVFLEKPLSSNTDNLADFVKHSNKSNGFIMIGYILRFLPALQKIKKIIETNQLGNIYTAHIQVGQYLPDWRPGSDYRKGVSAQSALGGGVLLELSHELDYATWLFGHPENIYCRMAQSSELEVDIEDNAHIIFEYGVEKNNKTVVIQLDFLQRVPQMTLQIVGSEATLKADLMSESIILLDSNNLKGVLLENQMSLNSNEPYLKQFDYFFSKSFKNYKPQFESTCEKTDFADVTQATKIMKLIDNARLSNKLGARI